MPVKILAAGTGRYSIVIESAGNVRFAAGLVSITNDLQQVEPVGWDMGQDEGSLVLRLRMPETQRHHSAATILPLPVCKVSPHPHSYALRVEGAA